MHKTLAAITLVSTVGVFAPGSTFAYYTDTETSQAITISTGTLDIASSESADSGELTPGSGTLAVETAVSNGGTLPFQYLPTIVRGACSDSFFNKLDIKIEHGGNTLYDGALSGAGVLSPRIDMGGWRFTLSLGADSDVADGELCSLTIRFNAWQQTFASFGSGGFTDSADISVSITADVESAERSVVLNEVYANTDVNNGHGGDEWVELYNNSDVPVDLAEGWKISETSGGKNGTEKIYDITPSTANSTKVRTETGSTIIEPHSWLVIIFDGNKLNNDSDTIRLYDSTGAKVDEYAYDKAAKGKSDARIPDGIGEWIDPVPTPGRANILEENPEADEMPEDPLDLSEGAMPPSEPVAHGSGSGTEGNGQMTGVGPTTEDTTQTEDIVPVTNEPETPANPLPPTEDTELVETPVIEKPEPEPEIIEADEPPPPETAPEAKPEEPDSPPAEQENGNPPEPQTNDEPPATE